MKGKSARSDVKVTLVRAAGLSVDLSAKAGAALPRRIKVLNWGDNPNSNGVRVFVGGRLLQALAASTYPYRKVPLDFEHNTLEGTRAYAESKEPRQVAGFGGVIAAEGDGVYIEMESWTPAGLANAANYADVSAGALKDESGEVFAIKSVALCRCGAVPGMDFKECGLSADDADISDLITQTQTEVQALNWRDMIAEALGMDPKTCSDEELSKALKAALGSKAAEPAALNAAVEKAVAAAIRPVADKVVALSASEQAFKAELEKRDKAGVVAQAKREGKVVALSADAIGKLSVADLQAHVDGLPVTVPLSARTPDAEPLKARAAGPSEDQRAIALNCGVDPEKVWPAQAK